MNFELQSVCWAGKSNLGRTAGYDDTTLSAMVLATQKAQEI